MSEDVEYRVVLPNGGARIYYDKKRAENAALIARALAAMPGKPNKYDGGIAKYGQQSQLAKALGYLYIKGNRVGKANHMRIFELLRYGYLPRSPERLQKLRDIAATVPEDWYENVECDCLPGHHDH